MDPCSAETGETLRWSHRETTVEPSKAQTQPGGHQEWTMSELASKQGPDGTPAQYWDDPVARHISRLHRKALASGSDAARLDR